MFSALRLWIFISLACELVNGLNMFGASSTQLNTMELSGDVVKSIANGAQMGMSQCQNAFKWNKWNCPESTFSKSIHHQPTREQAYAKAIVAAGVVHALARNCSSGQLEGCGCNPKLGSQGPLAPGRDIDGDEFNATQAGPISWSWGGCSDHVERAAEIAKHFLDGLEEDSEFRSMSVHNNDAGRNIVKQMMVKKCRCHGVSGSCSIQTCWMQVAPFPAIAHALKEKYHSAVKFSSQENPANATSIPPVGDLVYLKDSPDYCVRNESLSWQGVKGRTCSRNKGKGVSVEEKRSCRNVCRSCGLRVRKQKKRIVKRCNCSFQWCCEVKCETCVETRQEFYCD